MSVIMQLKCGDAQVATQLNLNEIESVCQASQQQSHAMHAYTILFDPEDSMGKNFKNTTAADIVNAADVLLNEVLPEIRSIEFYVFGSPMPGVPKGIASSIGGARVGDESLHFIGGLNEWEMWTFRKNASGTWERIKIETFNRTAKYETDNMGVVEVRSKKSRVFLKKWLRDIKTFLSKFPSDAAVSIQYM